MGYKELIEDLLREGEEKVRAIRQEAEAGAGKIRKDALRRIEEMRAAYGKKQFSALKDEVDAVLSEAQGKARAIRLSAEEELSGRLRRLAAEALASLRDGRYEEVFGALVKELPPYGWEIVKVNPGDRDIAKRFFPDSEIVADNAIVGGLEVMTKDKKILVRNTFEKRLDMVWEEILADCFRDVYKLVSGDE